MVIFGYLYMIEYAYTMFKTWLTLPSSPCDPWLSQLPTRLNSERQHQQADSINDASRIACVADGADGELSPALERVACGWCYLQQHLKPPVIDITWHQYLSRVIPKKDIPNKMNHKCHQISLVKFIKFMVVFDQLRMITTAQVAIDTPTHCEDWTEEIWSTSYCWLWLNIHS